MRCTIKILGQASKLQKKYKHMFEDFSVDFIIVKTFLF